MPRVLIIQEHLPHYRIAFFEILRAELEKNGILLELVRGRGRNSQYIDGGLQWSTEVKMISVGPMRWHWGGLSKALKVDLVVVPQEVKYPVCWLLQIARPMGLRLAFWGHGKNFQSLNSQGPAERFKRFLSRRADWWFAYNDFSARLVRDIGYPGGRITSVGNAIDTKALVERRRQVTRTELEELRKRLGLRSRNVGVYTGGLYELKRIDFLLQSACRIRELLPDFELIIIGDGPERPKVSRAAEVHSWIHDVGPKNDLEKVPYWLLSKLLLMPGGVGLVILDSFALGVPMVTTDTHLHGPEIDYLKQNVNGYLVPCGDSVEMYAGEVAELLGDSSRLANLAAGAMAAADTYTVEKMARNFCEGVKQALAASRLTRREVRKAGSDY